MIYDFEQKVLSTAQKFKGAFTTYALVKSMGTSMLNGRFQHDEKVVTQIAIILKQNGYIAERHGEVYMWSKLTPQKLEQLENEKVERVVSDVDFLEDSKEKCTVILKIAKEKYPDLLKYLGQCPLKGIQIIMN